MKPPRAKSPRSFVVLDLPGESGRVWLFERANGGVKQAASAQIDPGRPVPPAYAARSFREALQPRLRVAWLPPQRIYLRLLRLPPAELHEVPAMIEFELERVSPLPLNEIAWSYELIAPEKGKPLDAALLIAPRAAVEAFLGRVEQAGFLPDKLDFPLLRELLSRRPEGQEVVILAREGPEGLFALLGWWSEGRLEHLGLIPLSLDDAGQNAFLETLRQTAWTGEIAGWHDPSRARWRLMAPPEIARALEPALRQAAGERLIVETPKEAAELAALTAAARSPLNLLPPDIAAGYKKQAGRRVRLAAAKAALVGYFLLALGFLALLNVRQYQKDEMTYRAGLLYPEYTNALALKAQVQVLEEQLQLKFAVLDCLKAISDTLPSEMTLRSFAFHDGRTVTIYGTVPADRQNRVTEFNEALAKATVRGRRVFQTVSTRSIQARGRAPANWSIQCELAKPEPF